MSADTPLDLRADVVVLLRAWGWRTTDGRFLSRNGAEWEVSSPAGDSHVTDAEASYKVPFGAEVPADVIALACRATAGDPPAAPHPRIAALSEALTAALAWRTPDGLEEDDEHNGAVFDVVRAIAALVLEDPAPAPLAQASRTATGDWTFAYDASGQLYVRSDDVLGLLRTLAAAHRAAGQSPSAANLDSVADQLAASFVHTRSSNPGPAVTS